MKEFYYDAKDRMNLVRRMHENMSPGKVDDITWNDLEMDQVFLEINHGQSFLGEQYLYHLLHCPEDKISEDLIEEFEEESKLKRSVKDRLRKIGKVTESYYLYELLKDSDMLLLDKGWVIHLLQVTLIVFGIIAMVTQNPFFIAALVINGLINLTIYLFVKRKYEIFINTMMSFKEIYDNAGALIKNQTLSRYISEPEKRAYQNIKNLSRIMMGVISRKRASFTGDVVVMMVEYIYGVLLYDIVIYNLVMKGIYKKEQDVLLILQMIGRIDCAMNIAEYRSRVDRWCIPGFSDSSFKMEGLVHPLIDKPVENELTIDEKIIITGPNAAGKSTFIKAVAIGSILAQSINTVTANRFVLPKMKVMTCMALRDDVISHESYYYREANYIKRILEEVQQSNDKLFIVIDEILKGTNTKERIAASKAILTYLSERDVYVIITTHDMELTSQKGYVNFHFDSQILENEIVFDYRIHEGVSSSKNAIALLEYLQYPSEIITNARSYLNENRRSI